MCECADKVNDKLKAEGLALQMVAMLNMETGSARETVYLQTERLRSGTRVKRRRVIPTYCPFCGDALKPAA